MLIAVVGIFFYVWLRFNWQCGLGGITALIHDVILTVGFISLTGIEFNISAIAALLTVIGYSINNSVVIYDRIREYSKSDKNWQIDEIVDASIKHYATPDPQFPLLLTCIICRKSGPPY